MPTANRRLEEELSGLKATVETLREDLAARFSSLGDAAADQIMTRGRAAVGRAAEQASDLWDDAAREASRRGRKGAAALEQRIEESPFLSVLIAFGLGIVIGRLISR
jgi:ElaB/YqjD/DUF883 family membrane-anchored ribosome-binding protein